MLKKISFLKLLIAIYISVLFIISMVVSILSINSSKNDFIYESERLISTSYLKKENLVRREVEDVINELKRESNLIDINSNTLIKVKVNNYYEIIKNIYDKYSKTKNNTEIIEIIKTILASKEEVSNNLSDFIINLEGKAILFEDEVGLENSNIIDFKTSFGDYIIKDMIDSVKKNGENFYLYNWVKKDKKEKLIKSIKYNKISFIKIFKPLNILIGTGFCIDDYISKLQTNLLKKIKNIRFGERNSGYIIVVSNNGKVLTTDEKQSNLIGSDITELKDVDGKNVFKEMLRASFSNNGRGGTSTYKWIDPTTNIISNKIAFAKRFEDFGWIISGGIYTNDIVNDIDELKGNLEKKLDTDIMNIIITAIITVVILLVLIYFINIRLKQDYNRLIVFFKNLISKNEKIDVTKIRFTESKHIIHYANNMLDEKIKSEKNLKESEEKFRTLTDSTNIGVLLHRTNEILFVNNVITQITGFSEKELLSKTFFDIVHDDSKEFVINNFENELDGNNFIQHYDLKIKTKDINKSCWLNVTVNEIIYEDKNTYLISALDITARIEEQNQLFRERERLKVTLESIGDGVITTDSDGIIRFINATASNITGYTQEEARGKDLIDIFNIYYEMDRRRIIHPLKKVKETKENTVFNDHPYLLSKENKEFRISNSTAPIIDEEGQIAGVIVVFRDMTKFIEAEDELKKINNIESLGILAGGIAHDFNNLLSGMFGNLSIAKLYLAEADNAFKHVKLAEGAMSRATALTNQLLTFSKGGDPVKTITDIGIHVKASAEFSLSGSSIKLHSEIEDNLLLTEIDQGQINQVVSNLVINAIQSMQNGGNLYLKINNYTDNINEPAKGHLVKSFIEKSQFDNFVQIRIRDEGFGIKQNSLSKIFDPYFTTKLKGKGLGLASVHSIITLL